MLLQPFACSTPLHDEIDDTSNDASILNSDSSWRPSQSSQGSIVTPVKENLNTDHV